MRRGDLYPIYVMSGFKNNKATWKFVGFAKVLTISDGYAMLRFKGAMPFIKSVKDLERWKKDGSPGPLAT